MDPYQFHHKKKLSKIKICFGIFFVLFGFSFGAYAHFKQPKVVEQKKTKEEVVLVPPTEEQIVKTEPAVVPAEEIKKTVAAAPPKQSKAIKKISTTSANGTKTTVVTDGDYNKAEMSRMASSSASPTAPSLIPFTDETGNYASLEKILKDYLSLLPWGNEISSLKSIIIRDAGDTGWAGQYTGSYSMDSDGDIVSAFGYIVLNSYYYKDSPYINDYMKLVLSHEYGHHYTQYHKWVDYDLPAGTRFPTSYYETRSLSISNTTADCSSWSTCDSEIIAEDYSYLYSGYGLHAMRETYGFPTASTRNWLSGLILSSSDLPPTLEITTPSSAETLTGVVKIGCNATDDRSVSKVDFYLDDAIVGSDADSPYEISLNTMGYTNGAHTIKLVAIDHAGQQTEKNVAVVFDNKESDLEKPIITLIEPSLSEEGSYNWASGDLMIRCQASDNIKVDKIEIYINSFLAGTENSSQLSGSLPYFAGNLGRYTILIKAYDSAGNFTEKIFYVDKTG